MDFGLSKYIKPGKMSETYCGSLFYVAPEIIKGSYDQRVDVWSLGVIMHVLLAGFPPFIDQDDKKTHNLI
jgi:calcium-dependent protein kinase